MIFLVNDQRQVKDVVLFIEDIEEGKPFAMSIPRVEARDCQFLPFTTIVRSGHGVEVINMDPVMHDIQAYETSLQQGSRVLFNSPLPFNHRHKRGDMHATHDHKPSPSLVRQFNLSKGRKTFVMQCGFHAYMESWAIAVENPYYSFSDSQGQVFHHGHSPRNLPDSGVAPQHQRTNYQNRSRSSRMGLRLSMNFQLPSPGERKTAHKIRTPPRFTQAALGRPVDIQPIVEQQLP